MYNDIFKIQTGDLIITSIIMFLLEPPDDLISTL